MAGRARARTATRTHRYRGGVVRIGAWHGRVDVASLALHADRPPGLGTVHRLLADLARDGFRSVVTGALTPADSLPFVDAGFVVRERLHLLAHDLHDVPPPPAATRRARRTDRTEVLAIDGLAFEAFWRLDDDGLDDALRATPSTRFRVAGPDDVVQAYAIVGRAGRQGYVQRLASHPAARGRGLARALLADGLGWLRRHGTGRALVNTQEGNDAALALYRSCGFVGLPVGLCVLGRTL